MSPARAAVKLSDMTSPHTGGLDAHTLLNAVGGLIGFLPERSLVLIAVDADGSINATMRHDLLLDAAGRTTPEMDAIIANLAEICVQYRAHAIVALVVDDRYPSASAPISELMAAVDAAFVGSGGLVAGYAMTEYATGSRWRTVLIGDPIEVLAIPPADGMLADPAASPTALDRALRRGRPVLSKRSEMVAMLMPRAHCDGPCQHADSDFRKVGVASIGRAGNGKRQLLDFALRQVAQLAPEHRTDAVELACPTVDRWAEAIGDLQVRDALLALAITDHRHAAETMWRELTRRLRGSGRASAATLLAHLHYIAGEGAMAGVALDAALTADPDWSFAALLDRALRAGVRPSLLWEIIGESYRAADELGAVLPAATMAKAG